MIILILIVVLGVMTVSLTVMFMAFRRTYQHRDRIVEERAESVTRGIMETVHNIEDLYPALEQIRTNARQTQERVAKGELGYRA